MHYGMSFELFNFIRTQNTRALSYIGLFDNLGQKMEFYPTKCLGDFDWTSIGNGNNLAKQLSNDST